MVGFISVPISEVAREPASVGFKERPEKIPSTGKSLVQVVPILFLQSSEVIKLITPFLSTNAVVIDVPKTSQIIIVDTDASVKRYSSSWPPSTMSSRKKQAQVYVYAVQAGRPKMWQIFCSRSFWGPEPALATTSKRPQTTTTTTTPRPSTQHSTQPLPPSSN